MLYGFTIHSFRNFKSEPQWVTPLARVNVIIGTNNSGKSNVLRYIKRVVGPAIDPSRTQPVEQLEIDQPTEGGRVSAFEFWTPFPPKDLIPKNQTWEPRWTEAFDKLGLLDQSKKFARLQLSTGLIERGIRYTGLVPVADHSAQQVFQQLWSMVTGSTGGGYQDHWFPGVINQMVTRSLIKIEPHFIPSFRQIPTRMEAFADEFPQAADGEHLIDQLASLAYPSYMQQEKKKEFEKLRRFIGSIIGDPQVSIEIPNDRLTVNVNIGGKYLPIETLGSGIHEVFMLAAQIVLRPNQLILLEEPEVHLHPTLQRRFMKFVVEETKNQIFITTHSATIIDTDGVNVFEVSNKRGAQLKSLTNSQDRFRACRELGFKASDLLQSNSVVWVEGPSDRIYLNSWLSKYAPHLIEGIHFAVMFYGGKLLSRLTVEEQTLDDFIRLLPICRSPAILIDSDKSGGNSAIRATKVRIQAEFEKLEAPCWITDGREIENYYSFDDRQKAVSACHAEVLTLTGGRTRYDKPIAFRRTSDPKEIIADKIEVANFLTQNFTPTVEKPAFESKMQELVGYIETANG